MYLSALTTRKRTSGQSLVEFILFVPILLVLLLMAADLGRVYMGLVSAHNMVRVGANYAAINAEAWKAPDTPDKQAQRARYAELMRADARQINCELPSPLPDPVFGDFTFGSTVEVSVTCGFQLITPFLSGLIGDGTGNVDAVAATTFTVRQGGLAGGGVEGDGELATPPPTDSPPPDPTPSDPPTPDPDASPTPTPEPVEVSFHGVPTSEDSEGGGPPGSQFEDQIVGVPTLNVTFHNTTTGVMGQCEWNFGDGTSSNSCGNTVTKSYSERGTYHVTLTVNGQHLTRPSYVLVGCQVPSFAGVRLNAATGQNGLWAQYGFNYTNITGLPGSGNYLINYQSLAGGMINPPGGCSGAQISVGP